MKIINSIEEIKVSDLHAQTPITFDKNASFVYAVCRNAYMNNEADGHLSVEGLYTEKKDALQYMINRIKCTANKAIIEDIQLWDGGKQIKYDFVTCSGFRFKHVWSVRRWPVHHALNY